MAALQSVFVRSTAFRRAIIPRVEVWLTPCIVAHPPAGWCDVLVVPANETLVRVIECTLRIGAGKLLGLFLASKRLTLEPLPIYNLDHQWVECEEDYFDFIASL
jgi:hypothetical protein